jgi:hypothetical protein
MTARAFPRSGNPRKRIPAAQSPASAVQIPAGVGFAAATAVSTPIKPAARVNPVPPPTIVTRAESAPCTCPEHCERDHEND